MTLVLLSSLVSSEEDLIGDLIGELMQVKPGSPKDRPVPFRVRLSSPTGQITRPDIVQTFSEINFKSPGI